MEKPEVKPLFIFVWENIYWCTDKYNEVPLTAGSVVIHLTKEEVDYYWQKLTADGGQESQCGWLKDKFGLSWQVVPKQLGQLMSDPDKVKANKVMQAMLKMQKIVISDLEKAGDN